MKEPVRRSGRASPEICRYAGTLRGARKHGNTPIRRYAGTGADARKYAHTPVRRRGAEAGNPAWPSWSSADARLAKLCLYGVLPLALTPSLGGPGGGQK